MTLSDFWDITDKDDLEVIEDFEEQVRHIDLVADEFKELEFVQELIDIVIINIEFC